MSVERPIELDDRTLGAITEIQELIRERYPQASFSVARGEDPGGIYLRATVDVPDVEDVLDAFRDRLLELQIGEGLPLYVIPVEPVDRVVAEMRSRSNLPPRYQAIQRAVGGV
jgi:hypothetical protein